MSGLVRMALAFLPLAAYFSVLGVWQSGRRPRVVSGPRDFALLAFGLGGMIAFGPLGEAVIVSVFRRPSLAAWLAVASLVGLLALLAAARARKRLVVYQVEAADLDLALGRAMEFVAGDATRTLHGYEDVPGRRGVTVEVGRRLRFGVVEAHGDRPEALIEAIRPELTGTSRQGRDDAHAARFGLVRARLPDPDLTPDGHPHRSARSPGRDPKDGGWVDPSAPPDRGRIAVGLLETSMGPFAGPVMTDPTARPTARDGESAGPRLSGPGRRRRRPTWCWSARGGRRGRGRGTCRC